MRKTVSILFISPEDVGERLFADLRAIHPEGVKMYPSGKGHFSCVALPEDDPRVHEVLKLLDAAGMRRWDETGEMDRSREYVFHIGRHYEPADLEGFDFLNLRPIERKLESGYRDEEGRIRLGLARLDCGADFAQASVLKQWYVVPNWVKNQFESAGLLHVRFRPTVPTEDGGFGANLTWQQVGEPWWELTSDLAMPPFSPAQELEAVDGRPLDRGDFRRGVIPKEGAYARPELRYTAAAMATMPPFDLARTRELIGPNPALDCRLLIASRRFHEFCREHGLRTNWVPVRIE